MAAITEIFISGLNGEFDARIRLNGKHCIIVGPNGLGKSTALQIVAHALGRKWHLLANQRFEELEISWGKDTACITRAECAEAISLSRGGANRDIILELTIRNDLERFVDMDPYTDNLRVSFPYLRFPSSLLRQVHRRLTSEGEHSESYKAVGTFVQAVQRNNTPKTTFLPTSRRIEIELAKISEDLPEFVAEPVRNYLESQSTDEYFEEVVRFGMEDIEAVINKFEAQAQAESRNKFNILMANLLKEMANSNSISVRELREKDLSTGEIQRVLSRIEEGVLSPSEREKIVDTISSMSAPQKGGGHPPFNKKWLSHFFVRLQEADKELQEYEAPMLSFVAAIRKYMPPKEVRYDIETSRFSLTSASGRPIKLSELSSGEKQLTALLAMLEFSPGRTNVLIDEPELSLSVPWQTSILTDIVSTRSCNQLFAVTHSPFVFDNALSESVVDFSECLVAHE